jgi:hypothetical protein
MKTALVLSRCECQATLGAELDENRVVLRGFARDPRRNRELASPAIVTHLGNERFDVGWFCPFCIRNTLRRFDASSLAFREVPEALKAAAVVSVT